MPSNISSSEGLWASAKDLSLRKQRKSRSAPMKERLDNSSDTEQSVPAQETVVVTSKKATSQLSKALANHDSNHSALNNQEAPAAETPSSPPVAVPGAAKQKNGIFTRVRKTQFKSTSRDVFHFEGDGLQFRAKLIGIKDVESARGDEMCQMAMQDLKNSLKSIKGQHKVKIGLSVSLSGLTIKDEKATIVMHQHAVPRISYIWRDPTDVRSFGYVYGTPDTGHKFVAVKVADKSADTLVGSIHQLFQVAFQLKEREINLAKKGQDDTQSSGSGDSSKKENDQQAPHNNGHATEANLLDLENELFSLSQGLEQMNSMTTQADNQAAWADFSGSDQASDRISSASSTSSSDPWSGRGTSPQSIRTITPDPFDTLVQYGGRSAPSPPTATTTAIPRPLPPLPVAAFTPNAPILGYGSSLQSQSSWGSVPATPPNSLFSPVAQSGPSFMPNAFASLNNNPDSSSSNPFASFNPSTFSSPSNANAFSSPAPSWDIFGMNSVTTSPGLDDAFPSVFDPPPVPQRPVKEEKKPIDPFSTGPELFGDILNFGAPRTEKTSKLLFPQPVKPTIGDLRGEPTVIIPAPTTVDPFFVAPSLGLSVSVMSHGRSL